MRKGFDPKIFFTAAGDIFAIATGSDTCTEHECGSRPMQESLSSGARAVDDEAIKKVIREAKPGVTINYPDVISRKAMDQNLASIRFFEGVETDGRKVAAIVHKRAFYEAQDIKGFNEISFGLIDQKPGIVGAWCDDAFAFKVAGDDLVRKLKIFFDAIQAGDGVFSGTFMKGKEFDGAAGVMVALRSKLDATHSGRMEDAQKKYEANLRLQALSRVSDLESLVCNSSSPGAHGEPGRRATTPGYIWPVWMHGIVDGTVVYAVNPTREHEQNVGYFGPYTFEAMRDWIITETKYKLVPVAREMAVA